MACQLAEQLLAQAKKQRNAEQHQWIWYARTACCQGMEHGGAVSAKKVNILLSMVVSEVCNNNNNSEIL